MVTLIPSPVQRLAAEARRRGIRILVEHGTGAHFATSASDPGLVYRVTAYSCTCPAFLRWSRCTHHALLLAEKGWLPEDDPPAAARQPPAEAEAA